MPDFGGIGGVPDAAEGAGGAGLTIEEVGIKIRESNKKSGFYGHFLYPS